MKNLIIIIGGFIAYLFFTGKQKTIVAQKTSDTEKDKDKEKEVVQKKVIVREGQRNNLGMLIPDLTYLDKPIKHLRTNKEYKTVSEKNTSEIIKDSEKNKIVSNTRTQISITQDKLDSVKKIEAAFSRFSLDNISPLKTARPIFSPVSRKAAYELF